MPYLNGGLFSPQDDDHYSYQDFNAAGQYAVNTDILPFEQVEPRLKQELANQEEPAIVLRVDKDVATGETVKIMEIANRNRWKFTLATQP